MKTALVPAQVTTVEDKIAGSLGLQQLFLLAAPVFISGVIYLVFPPFLKLSNLKIVICGLTIMVFAMSAMRIKGQVLLMWVIILVRYNLRPRYFIYDKNDLFLRTSPKLVPLKTVNTPKHKAVKQRPKLPIGLPTSKLVHLESIIADPRANISFRTTKKGGLSVHITEVD